MRNECHSLFCVGGLEEWSRNSSRRFFLSVSGYVSGDSAAFSAKYLLVSIVSVYTGALADEGERLTLLPSVGSIDHIAFRPFDPWATGTGSL